MNPTEFRDKLRSGDLLLGTLLVAQTPFWPKILGSCGLDFVFIDTEHIAIGRESVSWMCRTYAAMGLPPVVRMTSPDPYDATMLLDDGAAGIVAPYIEKGDEVYPLVGACRYRPLKGKRLDETIRGRPLEPSLKNYIRKQTAGNSLIVNIESVPAIENLDAILAIDGLDAVLIGPHDLSSSLGIPERYEAPKFLKAAETILGKARKAGIGAGIHYWGTLEESARFIEMGANLFIHKADAIFFREGLNRELREIRSHLGQAPISDPTSDDVNI